MWIVKSYHLSNLIKNLKGLQWSQISWPINRCHSFIQNHTKTITTLVFSLLSQASSFLSFKGVRIATSNPCKFWPNQWFKHFLNIIWKLFEPFTHHKNTQISESLSNLHKCIFWALTSYLPIYSCTFQFFTSNIIHISHMDYSNHHTWSVTPQTSKSKLTPSHNSWIRAGCSR